MALIIVKFFEDPGRGLRTTIRKRDSVYIIFNYRLRLPGGLLCGSRLRNAPSCGSARWFSRLNIASLVRLLILRLSLNRRRYRLREVFLEQRLKGNDDEERQREDEKQSPLGAGVLLRI